MKKIISTLLLSLLFINCKDENVIYQEFQEFSEAHQWQKNENKTFEIEISKEANYDLNFKISHVYGFQFDNLPLTCIIEDSNGNKETIPFKLGMKDASGKDLGDCTGDICDLDFLVKSNINLKQGKYKVIFSHSFKFPYIPNIIGVGCSISNSK